jgi:hypothetical protein
MSHPEIGVFRDVVVLIPELAGEPGDAELIHFARFWTAVVSARRSGDLDAEARNVTEEAPNGWTFSGEPSERSERPERKRGRRVRGKDEMDSSRDVSGIMVPTSYGVTVASTERRSP